MSRKDNNKFYKKCFILLLFFISPLGHAKWNQNDVTILFPLPVDISQNTLLFTPQSTTDEKGELFPLTYMDELFKTQDPFYNSKSQALDFLAHNFGALSAETIFSPDFNNGEDYRLTHQKLRVVALRIDPCFSHQGQCLPQIRMIWQPLSTWGRKVVTDDASVHTFHLLTKKEFEALMTRYASLLASYKTVMTRPENQVLQIHPILRAQGLGGAFMNSLKSLILPYCGEKNLWRVTAMKTFVGGDMWAFFGYDVLRSQSTDWTTKVLQIPRLSGSTSQIFRTSMTSERNYARGDLLPRPIAFSKDDPDLISLYLLDSMLFNRRSTQDHLELGKSLARIENPDVHSPETMDCLTCHAAYTAQQIAHRDLPWLKNNPFVTPHLFKSQENLEDTSQIQIQTKNLRALGYFEDKSVISNRVRFETIRIIEAL